MKQQRKISPSECYCKQMRHGDYMNTQSIILTPSYHPTHPVASNIGPLRTFQNERKAPPTSISKPHHQPIHQPLPLLPRKLTMCQEVTELYALCSHYGRTWCEPCRNYEWCTQTGTVCSVLQDFCPKCYGGFKVGIAQATDDAQDDKPKSQSSKIEGKGGV